MDKIQDRINELRKEYTSEEDQSTFSDWEKKAKAAALTTNLKNHAALQIIIENYEKELQVINKTLADTPELFMKDDGRFLGLVLHEKKKFIKRFLLIFSSAEQALASAEKKLESF